MKRLKTSRHDFLKGSAFITGSVAGAGLFTGANPELEAALDQGRALTSLPELVRGEFLPGRHSIVVSGTHGN